MWHGKSFLYNVFLDLKPLHLHLGTERQISFHTFPFSFSSSSFLPSLDSNICCQHLLLSASFFFLFLFFFFRFFFPFIFISWGLITLQYCSGFCHTLTWISYGFTCILHPDPPSHLPLHLGLCNAPALSTCLMHPTWAGDLFHPW